MINTKEDLVKLLWEESKTCEACGKESDTPKPKLTCYGCGKELKGDVYYRFRVLRDDGTPGSKEHNTECAECVKWRMETQKLKQEDVYQKILK